MKAFKPVVETGIMDEGSMLNLPKFDVFGVGREAELRAMRLAVLAGMLVMGAVILAF